MPWAANKGAAVRLMQELEIHTLIPRFGLDGVAPEASHPKRFPTLEGTVWSCPKPPRRALFWWPSRPAASRAARA